MDMDVDREELEDEVDEVRRELEEDVRIELEVVRTELEEDDDEVFVVVAPGLGGTKSLAILSAVCTGLTEEDDLAQFPRA